MWRSIIGTECVCARKTYSIAHIYHLSTHVFTWSSPVWLFLLHFFSPLLDHAPCSQGDETTMLSISRPSWRYRKIKTRVPRTWQTTPLQHQCAVTPISSPATETNPWLPPSPATQNQLILQIWPSSLRAMSFSFIAMMTLVGSSVVIAFVLQPSKEELQAPANSPLPHHRSVPWCRFQKQIVKLSDNVC